MKILPIILATISTAAFAQQIPVDKNRNHILSPKEKKEIQNKIEKPALADDKKTKTVEKTYEVKSGNAVETTKDKAVPKKVVKKKKKIKK